MVLAVLDLGKIAKESLSGPEGPGTVKIGMPSKKEFLQNLCPTFH